MTVPHRNDVAGFATSCPDHDDQTFVEMACGNKTRLAVIEAMVDNG
jgi:hypothetical protein